MSGFDTSEFLDRPAAKPEPVATVAKLSPDLSPPSGLEQPSANVDVWNTPAPSVATVASVAELTLDKPFAQDLNRLFHEPECARYAGKAWERLLMAVHRFADTHAQACLAAGWSARELFAVPRAAFAAQGEQATAAGAVRSFRSAAVCFMVGKREVIDISAETITILVDRHGTHSRIYRDHNPINHNPKAHGLIWEVDLFP